MYRYCLSSYRKKKKYKITSHIKRRNYNYLSIIEKSKKHIWVSKYYKSYHQQADWDYFKIGCMTTDIKICE